jgi:hypothetical protein
VGALSFERASGKITYSISNLICSNPHFETPSNCGKAARVTDITPGVRPPRWATLVGTWIDRARVFAARVKVIFQLAPILATGVIGLLAGLLIAQWSQQQIAGNSPLAGNIPRTNTATTSAMSWLADDSAVIFFEGGPQPVFFHPSGEIDSIPPLLATHPNDAAMSALIVQPAEDGVLTARTSSFEMVTPGGLAAIDGKGSLYVTGAARIRNTDKSNERGIEAKAPNGQTVWRTEVATAPSKANQPTQFLPALPWDTTVTAMIGLPGPGRIAVGGADGRVALLGDARPTLSADRAAARKGTGSHGAPVVALTAGNIGRFLDQGRALFASAASDGSIKVWYPLSEGDTLTSRDVLFPPGSALTALAPDILELSDDGQLLTARTPAGAIFVARLGEMVVNPVLATGAIPSSTVTLAELQFDQPVTASALSRGSGASLYVTGPDCSIQEVDLANVTDNRTPDGVVTRATPVSGKLTLRGHNGPISRLAVSHNGQYLAAASLDGRVRIHHLASLRYVAMLPFADLPTGPDCARTAALELPPLSDAQPDLEPDLQQFKDTCPGLQGSELEACRRVNVPCYAMHGKAYEECKKSL